MTVDIAIPMPVDVGIMTMMMAVVLMLSWLLLHWEKLIRIILMRYITGNKAMYWNRGCYHRSWLGMSNHNTSRRLMIV
jgi:hypothetical protein